MTESIKQEIINNIFENGDKLITGPILQTVLIDMIDDVNVKDQAILSKTGSWDDAVTQIPNLATKEEVTNLSESVARDLENVVDVDLTGYATEQWVQNQGYLKEHQDISGLATKTELNEAKSTLESNLNNLSSSVSNDIQNKGEEVKTWVQDQGYLTEHQDISGLATKTELTAAENNLQGNITSLSESVARDLANVSVPEGVATEAWVQSQGYLTEHQDISGLATKGELNSVSQSVQTDITNLSESVANSAVWKKGTGQDSVVQVLSGDLKFDTPTATNLAAVATGRGTKAPGMYSHAEGYYTNASGIAGHAEGIYSKTYGHYSHAEGNYTVASNECEHAQGRYNHSSENQIFSIGTGNSLSDRRNAVSVLEVDNSGSYTSSFFVQNIGGYDGTNPLPGTNDLATVINNLPSGGGSSETLWKKGTGQDSIVQKLSGNREANTPTATESGSIATGYSTTASGMYSHAEGYGTTASELASHAEGYSTKASNRYSHAEGNRTIASGEFSHAEGDRTIASGSYSHAEGDQTTASANYSHAEGIQTEASGPASHAEGAYSTKASGLASHAEGIYAEASGDGSHAEGRYTIASNQYEHAQGMYNLTSSNQIFSVGAGEMTPDNQITRRNAVSILAVPNSETQVVTASFFVQNIGGYDGTNPEPGTNDLATVINGMSSGGGSSETLWKKGTGTDSIVQILTGDNESKTPTASGTGSIATGKGTTASGSWSHAEGFYAKATGEASHAEGYFTTASGNSSHAEGYNTEAPGNYSHVEGDRTVASKDYSHAEGTLTNASGEGSHAEGYRVIATGSNSHAEGYFTEASGIGSHAEGSETKAEGYCSHAEGYFAVTSNDYEHAQGRYNHTSSNQIFSIGTGNSKTDRRNAVSVLEVSNSGSYTSSFFVQNVGGYDGTNPEPGTNDLATVLNNTETWTFTLEDGTTVTKTIRIS